LFAHLIIAVLLKLVPNGKKNVKILQVILSRTIVKLFANNGKNLSFSLYLFLHSL